MDLTSLNIFYWGPIYEGSTSRARLEALQSLGCRVTGGSSAELYRTVGRVSFHLARHLGLGPLVVAENRALLEAVDRPYDVIWLDKAMLIRPSTLRALRRWAPSLIHFTPDPMFPPRGPMPLFLRGIPLMECHATTKPHEVPLYLHRGAPKVVLCTKSYDPALHRSYPSEELEPFRSDITFVGYRTRFKEAEIARI